jgi:hypothetical protein
LVKVVESLNLFSNIVRWNSRSGKQKRWRADWQERVSGPHAAYGPLQNAATDTARTPPSHPLP